MERPDSYQVVQIADGTFDDFEPLGTKEKYWYGNKKYLFKEGRQGTGEHWAEKAACEIGRLLELPYVHYDFACFQGRIEVVSTNFVPDLGTLVHGNELIAQIDETYPSCQRYGVKEYTISAVINAIQQEAAKVPYLYDPPEGIKSGVDVFIGYLLLDAWIANQDRHGENWGLIYIDENSSAYLAPTFDHAASLGRNENDARRKHLLELEDKNRNIENYIKRATSPFYNYSDSPKRIKTIDAFYEAAAYSPKAGLVWLDKLDRIKNSDMIDIFDRIPKGVISKISIDFAMKMLMLNKKRLLEKRGVLK